MLKPWSQRRGRWRGARRETFATCEAARRQTTDNQLGECEDAAAHRQALQPLGPTSRQTKQPSSAADKSSSPSMLPSLFTSSWNPDTVREQGVLPCLCSAVQYEVVIGRARKILVKHKYQFGWKCKKYRRRGIDGNSPAVLRLYPSGLVIIACSILFLSTLDYLLNFFFTSDRSRYRSYRSSRSRYRSRYR